MQERCPNCGAYWVSPPIVSPSQRALRASRMLLIIGIVVAVFCLGVVALAVSTYGQSGFTDANTHTYIVYTVVGFGVLIAAILIFGAVRTRRDRAEAVADERLCHSCGLRWTV
jgi:protein-S-isoprenylcysteine O-methyltransferase Ste14